MVTSNIPNIQRVLSSESYPDGQRIDFAMVEVDGVDEKCMLVYVNDKLDYFLMDI